VSNRALAPASIAQEAIKTEAKCRTNPHRYNAQVDVYDPWIDVAEAQHEYGLNCLADMPAAGQYAAIVLAVSHHQFLALGEAGIKALGQPGAVLFDVKSILPLGAADGRLQGRIYNNKMYIQQSKRTTKCKSPNGETLSQSDFRPA